MGLISFIKEAGEKLFGKNVKAAEAPTVDPAAKANADREAATAIESHLAKFNFSVTALTVTFDTAAAPPRCSAWPRIRRRRKR